MQRRERALAAVEGRATDRPAVCFWHHFPGLTGQDMVQGHTRFYRESQVDLLKMMCDEFFFYPLPRIDRPGDWRHLRPQGPHSAYIQGQVERASQIVEALGGQAFTLYNAFAPLSSLKHAYGDEKIMAHLRADQGAVLAAMDVIAQDTCTLVERILTETGVDGMFLIVQSGEEGRFTLEAYRRLIAPSELRVIQLANRLSRHNVLHMCGWAGVPNRLELWQDYPAPAVNLAVYNEGITLAQGKARFPDRVVMGGFDRREQGLLHAGTPQQVRQETRRLVEEAGADKLIVSADCSLPSDVPYENLRSVVQELDALAQRGEEEA